MRKVVELEKEVEEIFPAAAVEVCRKREAG